MDTGGVIMGQTPIYRWPYPEGTDPPAGNIQIKALADAIEPDLKKVADVAARDFVSCDCALFGPGVGAVFTLKKLVEGTARSYTLVPNFNGVTGLTGIRIPVTGAYRFTFMNTFAPDGSSSGNGYQAGMYTAPGQVLALSAIYVAATNTVYQTLSMEGIAVLPAGETVYFRSFEGGYFFGTRSGYVTLEYLGAGQVTGSGQPAPVSIDKPPPGGF